MQRTKNGFFGFLPVAFCVLSGAVFIGILVLLVAGQPWLETFYQNRSLLNNLLLWIPAMILPEILRLIGSKLKKPEVDHERRSLWLTRAVFALVLIAQFVVARACWYKMGWDISVVYTTAEELAYGQALSHPDYFQLCPNNAPLTILQFIPMWVAVKIGLAVPFVVLPYIDAVLLNLSAYFLVRCVQMLTKNRIARGFSMAVAVGWIAMSPYILYPYTDTFAILFPILALYAFLRVRNPVLKAFAVSGLCFMGACVKPTVLIVLIALAILSACEFFARKDFSGKAWLRVLAVLAAVIVGMLPGKLFQDHTTAYLAGEATPQGQLCETHYLMLGMNGETYGGHSPADVEFSTSFETLSERRAANIRRAWERVTERSLWENVKFFSVKAYKAYADGSFAAHSSFLELEVPRRTDTLSTFLRDFYYEDGSFMPYCQTAAQCLWLMILLLCARSCIRLRKNPAVAVLALTLLGVTAYLLLFEVWPRYLFLYAPLFVVLASLALAGKPLSFKRKI